MGSESGGSAISIHAPHTGRDLFRLSRLLWCLIFQSTRPIRGATLDHPDKYQYSFISIHAPHTGRDLIFWVPSSTSSFQSTRPIRGATLPLPILSILIMPFQSTRPIRGATLNVCILLLAFKYFNPRAPYGARRLQPPPECHHNKISIHAPHTGRDLLRSRHSSDKRNFNPRAPYGARRSAGVHGRVPCGISIHAPHTGRDVQFGYCVCRGLDISIHAPHTGRDLMRLVLDTNKTISIHAPHTGRDSK